MLTIASTKCSPLRLVLLVQVAAILLLCIGIGVRLHYPIDPHPKGGYSSAPAIVESLAMTSSAVAVFLLLLASLLWLVHGVDALIARRRKRLLGGM